MKTLILGMHAIGKTALIQNEIIPTLPDYTVIDVCQEYNFGRKDNLFNTTGELPIPVNPKKVDKHIKDCLAMSKPKDHVWILEALSNVYGKLRWLSDVDKNFIMTFYSIDGMKKTLHDLPDIFDTVYMFPTQDADYIRKEYMDRIRPKTKIIEVSGRKLKSA